MHILISGYQHVEEMIKNELDHIPYVVQGGMAANNVWSPRLATIFIEICSQLDSCFRHEMQRKNKSVFPVLNEQGNVVLKDGKPSTRYSNMGDYRNEFRWLPAKKVLFWQDDSGKPVGFKPFRKWKSGDKGGDPVWWEAYNKIKHDRLGNRDRATLKNCVEALSGLFLAIINAATINPEVERALFLSDWWSASNVLMSDTYNKLRVSDKRTRSYWVGDLIEPDDNSLWHNLHIYSVIESKLFSYPLGWWNDKGMESYYTHWSSKLISNKPGTPEDNPDLYFWGRGIMKCSNKFGFYFNDWVQNWTKTKLPLINVSHT